MVIYHPRQFLRHSAGLCSLALGLVAAFCSPKAAAYVFEPGRPNWASGTVTFQMSFGNAGRTLTDGNTSWDAAAAPACSIWNQSMQRVNLVSVPNPSTPVSRGDGVNSISFASTFFGQSFGSNTLAITTYSYSGSTMREADVLFNNRIQWDSYRGSLRYGAGGAAIGDIRRVLIHELGHALGLDHPDDAGQRVSAVMNSVMSNVDTTTQDDITGVQSLYGAGGGGGPTPTPTPNPTPTPQPTPPLRTATVTSAPGLVSPGQTAVFTISLSSANPNAATTVNYFMSGKALQGRHYQLGGAPGTVTISAGATSANVTLTALSAARRSKTATMFLATGSGYSLSSVRSASVTITR